MILSINHDYHKLSIGTQGSYSNPVRKIMSRTDGNKFSIVSSITPPERTNGCLVCCNAPACCPLCSIFPCCGEAEYIDQLRYASTYIYVRENSIEWNDPQIVMMPGICCGIDPCLFNVQDNVNVIYFDDIMFESITDRTRICNECRTCICGGRGERIRMDSPACCNCCQRSTIPCLFIPSICPKSLCPCILRHEIYMKDAQQGLYDIKKARTKRLENDEVKILSSAI
eukprot:gene12117-16223_t